MTFLTSSHYRNWYKFINSFLLFSGFYSEMFCFSLDAKQLDEVAFKCSNLNICCKHTKTDGEIENFHMKGLQKKLLFHVMKTFLFKTVLFHQFLVVVPLLLLFSNDDRD